MSCSKHLHLFISQQVSKKITHASLNTCKLNSKHNISLHYVYFHLIYVIVSFLYFKDPLAKIY